MIFVLNIGTLIICFLRLSGASPFIGTTNQETMTNVSSGNWQFKNLAVWDKVSDLAKDFITKLIVKNKEKRMAVAEALAHPWITTEELEKKRGKIPVTPKGDSLIRKHSSDVLLPIGKIAQTGAIFQHKFEGVFEKDIKFETNIPPRLLKCLEDVVANVGDLTASLICEIEGLPQPAIKWLKDGKEIHIDGSKYEAQFEGRFVKLNVKNIVKADSGIYSIIARNELGAVKNETRIFIGKTKEEKKEKIKKVVPKEIIEKKEAKKAITPFEFQPKLVDISSKTGDSILLSVAINSYPESEVQWFKNDEAIDINNPRFTIEKDNGLHNLKIISCDITDSTKWKVLARNAAVGQCESECNITVIEVPDNFEEDLKEDQISKTPKFIEKMQDVKIKNEGDMVTLKCKISGEPEPDVHWLLNGKAIADGRIRIHKSHDGICVLEIVHLTTELCGIYTAVAHNIHGDAHADAEVTLDAIGKFIKNSLFMYSYISLIAFKSFQIPCFSL